MCILCLCCSKFLGQESGQEEADDIQASSLCSSPEEQSDYGEWSYPLEQTEEYALNNEVEKRLNQMVPVPVSLTSKKCCYVFISFP